MDSTVCERNRQDRPYGDIERHVKHHANWHWRLKIPTGKNEDAECQTEGGMEDGTVCETDQDIETTDKSAVIRGGSTVAQHETGG